jgi:hypothetical protein
MANVSKAKRCANPALTKNGKQRIKILNLTQLEALFEKTSRLRDKNKIRSRILVLKSR